MFEKKGGAQISNPRSVEKEQKKTHVPLETFLLDSDVNITLEGTEHDDKNYLLKG